VAPVDGDRRSAGFSFRLNVYSDVRFAVDEFLGITGLLQRRKVNQIGLLLQRSAPVFVSVLPKCPSNTNVSLNLDIGRDHLRVVWIEARTTQRSSLPYPNKV
jgi:hypothetical protein